MRSELVGEHSAADALAICVDPKKLSISSNFPSANAWLRGGKRPFIRLVLKGLEQTSFSLLQTLPPFFFFFPFSPRHPFFGYLPCPWPWLTGNPQAYKNSSGKNDSDGCWGEIAPVISSKNHEHPEQSPTICCKANFAAVRDQENCNLGQTTRSHTPHFSIYKTPILLPLGKFLGLQSQICISWRKALTSVWITWTISFSLQHNKYLLSISSGQALILVLWVHKWTLQGKDPGPHGAYIPAIHSTMG